jgi:hypothetical protein
VGVLGKVNFKAGLHIDEWAALRNVLEKLLKRLDPIRIPLTAKDVHKPDLSENLARIDNCGEDSEPE